MADTKPDCYTCRYRAEVPGSAHSACTHPATQYARTTPFMQLAGVVGKRGGPELVAMAESFGEGPAAAWRALNIRGVAHGIRSGWFIWPVNFDPVWLESCDGFTPQDQPTVAAQQGEAL